MKALEIMMYLLIFNMVLWLVGGYGLGLINFGAPIETKITPYTNNSSDPDVAEAGVGFMQEVATVSIVSLLALCISYIGTSALFPIYNINAFMIAAFISLFWTSFIKTVQVFYSIATIFPAETGVKVFLWVLAIFFGICVYVFYYGILQIISGPWGIAK